jgi:hypothetical protein
VKLDDLYQHVKIYNVKRKLKRVTEVARAAAKLAALAEYKLRNEEWNC